MSPISPAFTSSPSASRMRISVPFIPTPTLPWWASHSSPRSAVTPIPSVMP